MKNRKDVSNSIEKALQKRSAFDAVDSILLGPSFPRVLGEQDLQRLPPILRKMCLLQAFVLHSGAGGLLGLFADSSVNTKLAEIETQLADIGAAKSLRFLKDLKASLPSKRYPRTQEQARKAEKLLAGQFARSVKARKCPPAKAEEYRSSTHSLPEEMRTYFRQNQEALVDAVLAALEAKGGAPQATV